MADGFIVRKGGVSSEQALAPTITEVSTSDNTIVFTLKNNDTESAVILYETNDEVPDENGIELAGGATSGNLTITGLTVSPAILYASANVVGKVKSNITERSFTFTLVIYTAATGGTTLEYDDGGKRYKSHTFLQDGNFVVSTVGDNVDDRNKVDYLIIAGGGTGSIAGRSGGGGGAGGYRTTLGTSGRDTSARDKVVVTTQSFPIFVGAGGAGITSAAFSTGNDGTASSGLGITTVGGGGGRDAIFANGSNGGSGGGANDNGGLSRTGGLGTAEEGNNGGNSAHFSGTTLTAAGGGGGGALQAGANGTSSGGGKGGDGLGNLLRTGSNETRAGGGGGSATGSGRTGGNAGLGGATAGVQSNASGGNVSSSNATANTGSGSGGAIATANVGSGGSGIVVIRYEIAPSV